MASYYDEHNCKELKDGEAPDHFLHLARLLLDSGVGVNLDMEFERIFGQETPPGAARHIINNLPDAEHLKEDKCSICLGEMSLNDPKEKVKWLPCRHSFHEKCIVTWIKRVSACPLCKHELPTDDEKYEEFKRQKKRQKEREAMIEDLHNSMFG